MIAAAILLQTLFFKFSGARESVYIFSQLGVEPWGRIGTGVLELITAALLLIPRTRAIGGVFTMGILGGAIMSHLTILGITMPAVDDKGELFALALTVFACGAGVAWLNRRDLPVIGSRFAVRHQAV